MGDEITSDEEWERVVCVRTVGTDGSGRAAEERDQEGGGRDSLERLGSSGRGRQEETNEAAP